MGDIWIGLPRDSTFGFLEDNLYEKKVMTLSFGKWRQVPSSGSSLKKFPATRLSCRRPSVPLVRVLAVAGPRGAEHPVQGQVDEGEEGGYGEADGQDDEGGVRGRHGAGAGQVGDEKQPARGPLVCI